MEILKHVEEVMEACLKHGEILEDLNTKVGIDALKRDKNCLRKLT